MTSLLAAASGIASGVFLRSLFRFGWEPVAFMLLLATIFAAAAFLKPRLAYSLGAAFCIFIALGMARTAITDTPLPNVFTSNLRHRVSYDGIVVADPDVRDAKQRVEIRVRAQGQSTRVLAIAPRYPAVAVGDRVNVSGTLLSPQPFASGNGRIFRYDKYLERDGVRFILNFAFIRVESGAPWYSLPAALARVKHAFLDGLSAALPEPYAALAGGIVIGGKSGLGNDLQNAFVRSGLVQIIVLSGYNVMVVAEWVMAALALTKLPRRWGAATAVLAVLLFVLVAGASATALRAMLMAFIALYARATGRSNAAGRALLLVILLMLVWNPLYLVFDPGFGLSVTATAGLIWLAPIIEIWLASVGRKMFGSKLAPRHPRVPFGASGFEQSAPKHFSPERAFSSVESAIGTKPSFWINILATTLAAQIAVLPLLLYDTGNLSLVAIPANLLAIPLVPVAMGFSALAGFAGMLFGSFAPLLSGVCGLPAYLLNAYLLFIAQRAAALPFAAFMLPAFPFWLVLVSYAALIRIASSKRFSTTLQLRFAKKASI
ncbi:MAG: ComEC/Rec2 family competence protein [Minisyncoccota bacterium]